MAGWPQAVSRSADLAVDSGQFHPVAFTLRQSYNRFVDALKRRQNESKFESWTEHVDGGRTYTLRIPGRQGWSAVYVKGVDPDERTIRFAQEIYDESGRLIEVHEKFPVDLGHRKAR